MSELYALSHGQHFDDDDDGEFSDDAENGIKNGLSRSGPVAVLEGCMSLIDGRVFYSGEWYMKPQVSTAAALVKSKFKYKLKRGFDFKDPSDEVSMDGCFFVKTQSAEGGKIKIKERDAVLNFGSFEQKKSYLVNGKGENEYGKFLLVGKYFIKNERENLLKIEKRYQKPIGEDDNSDDDDQLIDVGEDDPNELKILKEEADIPVQELRKRYSKNCYDEDARTAKRQKAFDEDDELEF